MVGELLCELRSGVPDRVVAGCLVLGGMSPMEQEPFVEAFCYCLHCEGSCAPNPDANGRLLLRARSRLYAHP